MAEFFVLAKMRRAHWILKQKIDLDTGIVASEIYWRGKVKHRDPAEGPAHLERDPRTGIVIIESYMIDGQLHRSDGPASIERDRSSGIVTAESYYEYNALHRLDGPAIVLRDGKTGAIHYESYHSNGHRHRPTHEGPAVTQRGRTGVISHEFWFADRRVEPPVEPGRPDDGAGRRSQPPVPR